MITKAITVLETLAGSREPLGVSQLSTMLGMPVATVHRQLQALLAEDLVRQEGGNGLYSIGLRSFSLAQAVGAHRGTEQGRPVLRELNGSTSYATLLGRLNDTSFTYVDHLSSTTAISVRGRVGATGLLHATALGKAMLSRLEESELDDILSRLDFPSMTPATITDAARMRTEISQVREQGYACSRAENELQVGSVAVPFRAGGSQEIYAVCIASHISELEEVLSWVAELRDAATRLEGLI